MRVDGRLSLVVRSVTDSRGERPSD